jgi:hypothetical protein
VSSSVVCSRPLRCRTDLQRLVTRARVARIRASARQAREAQLYMGLRLVGQTELLVQLDLHGRVRLPGIHGGDSHAVRVLLSPQRLRQRLQPELGRRVGTQPRRRVHARPRVHKYDVSPALA